jgi:tetratricopeptide (TPR) repeat protein
MPMRSFDYPDSWAGEFRGHDQPAFRTFRLISAAGILLVLVGITFLALPGLTGLSSDIERWYTVGGIPFVLAGAVAALWRDEAVFDIERGELHLRRGIYPFLRHEIRLLADVVAVDLETVERRDSSGLPIVRANLSLEMADERLALLRNSGDEKVESIAAALADRLDRPLRSESRSLMPPRRTRIASQLIAVGLWTCMAAVAVGTLGPLLVKRREPPSSATSGSFGQMGVPFGQSMVPFGPRGIAPPALDFYRAGLNQYNARMFKDAEQAFARGVKDTPAAEQIWNMLAYAQAEQGKLGPALKSAQKAVSLAPEQGYIVDTLAEMHERRKEYKQAAKYYAEALKKMQPEDSCETNTKYGRTLIALHKDAEAKEHLLLAIRYPNRSWAPLAQQLLNQISPTTTPPSTPEDGIRPLLP